jgi:hypothetical protein
MVFGWVAMSLVSCKKVMEAGSTGSEVIVVRRLGTSRTKLVSRERLVCATIDLSNHRIRSSNCPLLPHVVSHIL